MPPSNKKIIAKKLFFIAGTLFLSILIICILSWTSNKPIFKKTGFSRKIPVSKCVFVNSIQTDSLLTPVGLQSGHYVFQTQNPGLYVTLDSSLQKKNYRSFKIPYYSTVKKRFISYLTDSAFYIFACNIPGVYIINKGSDSGTLYPTHSHLFSGAAPVSNHSAVFRCYETTNHLVNEIFVKEGFPDKNILKENNISEKLNDGGFLTDGNLLFDKSTHKVFFTSFYSNKITVLDSSLQLLSRSRTIDTFSTYQISAGEIEENRRHVMTNTAPARYINMWSFIYNKRLYINSNVKSDDQTNSDYTSNSVIDVYDTDSMAYLYSFYIPNIHHQKVDRFIIDENTILASYSNYVAIYRLN